MITLGFVNRKGGVGKTTMAAHAAAGLALRGLRVALVDCDSQGHAALSVGMDKENGLYALLVERKAAAEVARIVPEDRYSTPDQGQRGALWLVPSDTDTYLIPLKLSGALSLRQRLAEMAAALSLDVCILDTSPTASMFDGAVYYAADGVIYVTECEMLSLDGVKNGLAQLDAHNQERAAFQFPALPLVGILPNKLRAQTKVHRELIGTLGEAFPGVVWSPVRQGVKWTDASSYQRLVFAHAPHSDEARCAWEIVERVLRVIER